MASWIYDKKFSTGMQFLFGTSSFTATHVDDLNKNSSARRRSWAPGSTIRRVVHDDNLEHPTQELDDHVSSVHQKKLAMKNLIDGPTRPPIGTSSTTTRSFGLALTEIQTMKLEE
jgi:hypothetical protein